MNKFFFFFAALIAVALASSSSSAVPVSLSSSEESSSSAVPVVASSSSSAVPVTPSSSSSELPVFSSSSSSAGPENKTFVPFLDCAFHFNISAVNVSDPANPAIQEYYGYHNGKDIDKSVMLALHGEYYGLFRCDLGNATGYCYVQGTDEDYPECQSDYVPFTEAVEGVMALFPHFEYSTAEYPKDVDCVDGSKGCKIYCNVENTCGIADSKGRLVSMLKDVAEVKDYFYNFTYFDEEFDASIFAIDDCNGTKLSVPTNPCGSAPSGSSAASTSTSTSTSNSTKGSSSGSASVVEVAYAVVLAALLVALF